ncbi:hypothetical protein DMENIID0001_145580 [Sergentomyia squamirostris]
MPSYYKEIETNYGSTTSESFKRIAKLNKKKARFTSRKEYLCDCRSKGVVPIHIYNSFKGVRDLFTTESTRLRSIDRRLLQFHKQTLNTEINLTHLTLRWIDRETKKLLETVDTIDPEIVDSFMKKQKQFFKKELAECRINLRKKMEDLQQWNVGFNSDGGWLVNLTDIRIPPQVMEILSLGPKMGIPYERKKDIPLPTIIAEIEAVLGFSTLSEERKNSMRSQITNQLKNFMHRRPTKSLYNQRLLDCLKTTREFLKNNPDLIVISADKGGKTVLMYHHEYMEKMNAMVNDASTYKVLKKDMTTYCQTKNNEIVNKLFKGDHIDEITRKRMITYNSTAPTIYGLPKVHKEEHPLRPICSCIGLATYLLSRFLQTILKFVTETSPYNLKNSTEFVHHIRDLTIEDDEILKNEIDHTLDIFNNIHKLIQFTCERERDGCLPYLDVLVKRKESGTINTNWYSKPIASGRIMNFNSLHPLSQKVNTAMGLIHRVTTLTTDTDFNTTTTITDILKKNGYPRQTIGRIMRKYVEKPMQTTNNITTTSNIPEKKYVSMTYIPHLSEILKKPSENQ